MVVAKIALLAASGAVVLGGCAGERPALQPAEIPATAVPEDGKAAETPESEGPGAHPPDPNPAEDCGMVHAAPGLILRVAVSGTGTDCAEAERLFGELGAAGAGLAPGHSVNVTIRDWSCVSGQDGTRCTQRDGSVSASAPS